MSYMFDPDERASSVSDIRISSVNDIRVEADEINDDELKKLSEYFEKSRSEIQKKVDSLLAFDPPVNKPKNLLNSLSSSSLKSEASKVKKDFRPIDLETATALREITIGSCVHTFSTEWRRAKFVFRPENMQLPYGLISEKNGSKGLILSVQTILLKNLILMGYKDIFGHEVLSRILEPNDAERKDALVKSLAEILWNCGEKAFACVVLNSNSNCFEFSSNGPNKKFNYFGDGLTERLNLYDFTNLKSLEEFIKKNFSMFQKEDACLIFLYSLILSRRIEKIKQDLQGSILIGDMEDCRIPLYNLVLNGQAIPYLHNGSIYYDSNGKPLTKALIGLKDRSDVGILYWNPSEVNDSRTEVGSMLKTPRYPVWLALMGKNQMAVIFNTNIDLMNNWRLEQNFSLHFFSGLKKQEEECKIDITSREPSEIILSPSQSIRAKFSKFKLFEEEKDPEIYELIKTKWPECEISGDEGKELMALL